MSAFTFPVHNRVAQVENDVMSTDEHDDGTEAKPLAPAYDPATRSPQELEAMTLDELLDSLPLKPWDKNDPDPLIQLAIRLSSTTAPADPGADDHPAAPAEWRSPTMFTPAELESLRQEDKRSSEWMKAELAARRANKP